MLWLSVDIPCRYEEFNSVYSIQFTVNTHWKCLAFVHIYVIFENNTHCGIILIAANFSVIFLSII